MASCCPLFLAWVGLFALAACGEPTREPRNALAAGWTTQFDAPEQLPEPGRFIEHMEALELKPGANVNVWHPKMTADGNFRLSAEVTHVDSGLHPHGAGLTFGGSDASGKSDRYTYFLVRNDRHFLIKARKGEEYPEIVPWTAHDAASAEDKEGVTKNRLTIKAMGDEVHFLINESEVHRCKRSALSVDGAYGFRVVHDTHVRFGKTSLEHL